MTFLSSIKRSFGGSRQIAPEDSGVLAEPHLQTAGDTATNLASETIIEPPSRDSHRPEKPPRREPKDLLKIIEESSGSRRFELSGGGGLAELERMVSGLDGKILTDGGVVRARIEGNKGVVTVEGRPLEINARGSSENALRRDLADIEKQFRSAEGVLPIKIKVPDIYDTRYVRAFSRNIAEMIGREGAEKFRFDASNEGGRALRACLDGLLLNDGRIIRMSREGLVTTAKSYQLGENGWSRQALIRDFQIIKRNAAEAQNLGLKLRVWLDPHKLSASLLLPAIRAEFAKLRDSELGDAIDLRTDKSHVDKIPGFLGVKAHVAKFERHTKPDSLLEEREIEKCRELLESSRFKTPLVVWIKRSEIGSEASRYLRWLRQEFEDELKIIASREFENKNQKFMRVLRGESVPPSTASRIWSMAKHGAASFLRRNSETPEEVTASV